MSAHGKDGQEKSGNEKSGQQQPDDVRDMLRQLASQIKDQIADVDRRHNDALKTMEQRLQPSAAFNDEPWDMASAEALTRLYEGDAPEAIIAAKQAASQQMKERAPAPRRNASPPDVAPKPSAPSVAKAPAQAIYFADPPISAPARPIAVATTATLPLTSLAPTLTATALASDRAWLDARLADLQSKVEQSLSGFDPSTMLKPVNDRIDAFENQMLGVLETVAQKADLERFATLETDMTTVKGHVEAARGQLKRLDGIEEQLRALHAFATDAQSADAQNGTPAGADLADPGQASRLEVIEAMLRDLHTIAVDQQSAPPPEMPDFHGLAEKAADRAASNIVEQHMDLFSPSKRAEMHAQSLSHATGGSSLEEMQSLFEAYAEEHRHEQSQTAATLTTMQEALIRLIDRIEELAGEAPEGHPEEQQPAAAAEAPRFVEVEDERSPATGRRQADRQPQPMAVAPDMQTPQQTRQPTTRAPRMTEPAAVAPQTIAQHQPDDAADAAQAMAAERARVMAERNQGRRPPTARPQVQIAPDQTDDAASAVPADQPRKARSKAKTSMSKAQIGIAAALGGALMLGSAYIAFPMFSKRVVETKMDQRLPRSTPATTAPATTTPSPALEGQPTPAARPAGSRAAIPTEILDVQGRATTPTLPEAQQVAPAQRAQPTAGNPLPTQPAAREAPAPQVAPSSRAIETPAASQPRRRPTPETVTDDLSLNTQDPEPERPSFAETMGARVTTAAVQGIALDSTNAMGDPTSLARRQARLAPAADQEAVESQAEVLARGRADMPPAQIGPMSLRTAAQQGDPAAAFEVAARFAEAKGVKQDFQQALIWYSRAAQQGFVPAQYRLATIYEGGMHGTQDLPRAKVWYKRAADQGNVKAMHNLAVLAAGNGQSQPDYQTAAKWFSEAADRGLADSQFNLGVLHESGLGVPKDTLQAYRWFALGARSGDKEAIRRRDQLMASFTPQQAQTAEKLVQAWRAKPTDMKANDARTASLAWQEQQGRLAQQAFEKMQQQQSQQAQQQTQPAAPAQPAMQGKTPPKAPVAAEAQPKAGTPPPRTTASVPTR